jgi:hypothetical protein
MMIACAAAAGHQLEPMSPLCAGNVSLWPYDDVEQAPAKLTGRHYFVQSGFLA